MDQDLKYTSHEVLKSQQPAILLQLLQLIHKAHATFLTNTKETGVHYTIP